MFSDLSRQPAEFNVIIRVRTEEDSRHHKPKIILSRRKDNSYVQNEHQPVCTHCDFQKQLFENEMLRSKTSVFSVLHFLYSAEIIGQSLSVLGFYIVNLSLIACVLKRLFTLKGIPFSTTNVLYTYPLHRSQQSEY